MSEPKITERFIGENQIENIHISPSASIAYHKLDLQGKITSDDIDFGNPISESRLDLNYPTHPEDSTLVLENSLLLLANRLESLPISGYVYDLSLDLFGVPQGSDSEEGVIVDHPYNKALILEAETNRVLVKNGFQVFGRISSKYAVTQPTNITGVSVLYSSSDVSSGDLVFEDSVTTLSWDGGLPLDVSGGGVVTLYGPSLDYIVVYVDESALPLFSETDTLSFTDLYNIGFFYTDTQAEEVPVSLADTVDILYPITKSLYTRGWEDFFDLLTVSQVQSSPPPHEHNLIDVSDLTVSASELNQALSGISPYVTATNLSALTDGSSADSLHTHSNAIGAPSLIKFTSSNGQTVFNLGVSPSQVEVYIQGIFQEESEHYNLSGNQLILSDPADLGERVIIKYWD